MDHLFEYETTPDGVDPGAGGTGEGADRPEWLQEKFKTAEDQAKAYAEAEKRMNQLQAQADDERKQFAAAIEQMEAMTARQDSPPPAGVDPQTQQLLAQYNQAFEAGDSAAVLAIQLGLQQQMMNEALDARFKDLKPTLDTQSQADRNIAFELAQERVAKTYGDDWETIQPGVQKWLNEHPSVLPVVNDPAQFEAVVREATQIVVNERRAEQFAAFEADRAAKLGAQTAQGSGQGRYPIATDEKKQAWDEVKSADTGSYSERMSGR